MLAGQFGCDEGSYDMSAVFPVKGTLDAHREARCNTTSRSMLLTLGVCVVIRASQALAGDQPLTTEHTFARQAEIFPHTEVATTSNFSAPFVSLKPLSEPQEFSATEFRPRKHNVLELESGSGRSPLLEAPMLKSNSVWQHMAEFRSQGRVRLLTLWQIRGSSLSLQAGRHGAPSLQWSTPWVHREGGASRGLFDRLLPVPQHAFSGNARGNMPRPTMSPPMQSRTLDLAQAGNTK
jgi:hypothetical protein